jgi:hypothetical protein
LSWGRRTLGSVDYCWRTDRLNLYHQARSSKELASRLFWAQWRWNASAKNRTVGPPNLYQIMTRFQPETLSCRRIYTQPETSWSIIRRKANKGYSAVRAYSTAYIHNASDLILLPSSMIVCFLTTKSPEPPDTARWSQGQFSYLHNSVL